MVTLFFLPSGPLVRVSLIQSNSDFESTMPRLSVTSLTLCTPGTLRTWFSFSLPLRYSATVISVPIPETSENPPNALAAVEADREVECAVGRVTIGHLSFS